MRAGEQLKDLRNKLGITTRDVEEFSRKIAQEEGSEDFYISNAWLTQIENTGSIPSIHKLFSLSVIYQANYNDLLSLFGIELANAGKYQFTTRLEKTRLTNMQASPTTRGITFPVRFDSGFTVDRSNLNRKCNPASGRRRLHICQPGLFQTCRELILAGVCQFNSEQGQEVIVVRLVNDAQAEQFVNTWNRTCVFDLG